MKAYGLYNEFMAELKKKNTRGLIALLAEVSIKRKKGGNKYIEEMKEKAESERDKIENWRNYPAHEWPRPQDDGKNKKITEFTGAV